MKIQRAQDASPVKSESLLAPAQMDAIALAVLNLARELWVVKDRQMILESFLEKNDLVSALSAYQPNAEFSATLAKERERFVAAITDALLTSTTTES